MRDLLQHRPARRGSALLFVLIIMASVVTVVVGTQRLSLVQFSQTARQEDNQYALYAAKAGVEDGLLRFRHQRDVETAEANVHRYNVTTGQSAGEIPLGSITQNNPNGFPYDPDHQYYDVAINFRTDKVGDFNFNTGVPPPLAKDDYLELTGFSNEGTYYLRYAFQFVGNDCLAKGAFVQIQQITESSGLQTNLDQVTVVLGAQNPVDSAVTNSNLLVRNASNLTNYFRIRPYHCDVRYAFATALSLGGPDSGPKFDSLKTTITATGYYGRAKRTLQAEIDRKSGALLGIVDFNLYSGDGRIGPR